MRGANAGRVARHDFPLLGDKTLQLHYVLIVHGLGLIDAKLANLSFLRAAHRALALVVSVIRRKRLFIILHDF